LQVFTKISGVFDYTKKPPRQNNKAENQQKPGPRQEKTKINAKNL